MNRIEIPISRRKISLLLIGTLIFVILGAFLIITPENFVTIRYRNPEIIRFVGVAAVLFFGLAGIYGFKKLFDRSLGLIIDNNGITDNTNASSVGLIDWKDITEIKIEQVMSTKFLLIYTSDPNKYLDRAKGFKQKLMQGNLRMYGTPLSITSSTLQYKLDDLATLIKNKLRENI